MQLGLTQSGLPFIIRKRGMGRATYQTPQGQSIRRKLLERGQGEAVEIQFPFLCPSLPFFSLSPFDSLPPTQSTPALKRLFIQFGAWLSCSALLELNSAGPAAFSSNLPFLPCYHKSTHFPTISSVAWKKLLLMNIVSCLLLNLSDPSFHLGRCSGLLGF